MQTTDGNSFKVVNRGSTIKRSSTALMGLPHNGATLARSSSSVVSNSNGKQEYQHVMVELCIRRANIRHCVARNEQVEYLYFENEWSKVAGCRSFQEGLSCGDVLGRTISWTWVWSDSQQTSRKVPYGTLGHLR